jgi:DNA-binding NarL/FixJ family response regulator
VSKIRVVLADDHRGMVAIIRRILGEEFEVVGAVEDGEQAVDAVLKLNPDALVIDISMPILNGPKLPNSSRRLVAEPRSYF